MSPCRPASAVPEEEALLRIEGAIVALCLAFAPAVVSAEAAPAVALDAAVTVPAAPVAVEAAVPPAAPVAALAAPAVEAAVPEAAVVDPALPAPAPTDAVAPVDADDSADDGDDPGDDADDPGDDADDPGDDAPDPEAEVRAPADGAVGPGVRYTQDISDAELERRWREDPASLGSISIGFTDAGRLVNGVPFPKGDNWSIVDPANSWATSETVDYTQAAITRVADLFPETEPLRVNHASRQNGGWLRPHKSHQAGRDVDLAFYYRPGATLKKGKGRETIMDVARNWALVRAVVTLTDVQMVLVDRRIQQVLYDYALAVGENREWLNSLFRSGRDSIVQHARRHKDHFHVRYYNPRAQELGRRLQPLMGKVRPDENFAVHKVRRGDTLGGIARRYQSTIALLRKVNALKGNALRPGQTVLVPMRGPCVRCPVPPELVVPPRRLPPQPPTVASSSKQR